MLFEKFTYKYTIQINFCIMQKGLQLFALLYKILSTNDNSGSSIASDSM